MRDKSLSCFLKRASVLAAVLLPAALESNAWADDCKSLENPVYVLGSSAAKNYVHALALKLQARTPAVNLIYVPVASCLGVTSLLEDTVALSKQAVHWTPANSGANGSFTDTACSDLAANASGVHIDVGVSDVFADTCGPYVEGGIPANFEKTYGDFKGPIQAMTFVKPLNATSPSAISAEAAYLTLGFADGAGETAWTDPTQVFVRDQTSGTQLMIATAIGVPGNKWVGGTGVDLSKDTHPALGSGDVREKVAHSTTPELALGILATDVADGPLASGAGARTALQILPYQHYGQSCGYLPDSTASTYDKQNVRDGHYMIWGPIHFYTRLVNGQPDNPNAKIMFEMMAGEGDPRDTQDLIDLAATTHTVPDCAMRVSRDSEVGPLSSYMPAKSCECRFISVATGVDEPDGCTPCKKAADCAGEAFKKACNYGFCEVR